MKNANTIWPKIKKDESLLLFSMIECQNSGCIYLKPNLLYRVPKQFFKINYGIILYFNAFFL